MTDRLGRADLHVHTLASDGVDSIATILDHIERSTDLDDVKTAKNYVAAALDELAAGKPVTVAATHDYGCSVKYKTS